MLLGYREVESCWVLSGSDTECLWNICGNPKPVYQENLNSISGDSVLQSAVPCTCKVDSRLESTSLYGTLAAKVHACCR